MATEIHAGELIDRVEALTARVETLADEEARVLAQELVGAVMDMYGDGLARIMRVLGDAGDAGASICDELAQDGSVSSLLLIHDLYPVTLSERVTEALDSVRPYMESHGGNIELLGVEDGVARLRLQGSCSGCAASQATLELAIKQALDEHCPDLVGMDVEGVAPPPAPPTGLELPLIQVNQPTWVALDGATGLGPGGLRALEANGASLVLANVDGSLLAYRDECASCGVSLNGAALDGRILRCADCDAEFDLPRAGRAVGGEPLQLTPIPLLDDGAIRVAV